MTFFNGHGIELRFARLAELGIWMRWRSWDCGQFVGDGGMSLLIFHVLQINSK